MSTNEPSDFDSLLNRLELALSEERHALRRLDADAVEQACLDKLALAQSLRDTAQSDHRRLDPGRLERLRAELVKNQLLLVHARDTARGVLAIMTGVSGPSYGPTGARHLGKSAGLDTRG